MQTNYQPTHNLDLLRILYIVKACFNFLGVLGFIAYAGFGSFMFQIMGEIPNANQHEPFPTELSWIFIIIGAFGAVVFLIMAIITLMAASRIKDRKSHTFIIVVGVINCFTGMLGIGLGVFTFIELTKPHVRVLFQPVTEKKMGF